MTRRGSHWWSARSVQQSSKRSSASQCSAEMRLRSCDATPALRLLLRHIAPLRDASSPATMLRNELGRGSLRRLCRFLRVLLFRWHLLRALLPSCVLCPLRPARVWYLRLRVRQSPCRRRRRPLLRVCVRPVLPLRRHLLRYLRRPRRCRQFSRLAGFATLRALCMGSRHDGADIGVFPLALVI